MRFFNVFGNLVTIFHRVRKKFFIFYMTKKNLLQSFRKMFFFNVFSNCIYRLLTLFLNYPYVFSPCINNRSTADDRVLNSQQVPISCFVIDYSNNNISVPDFTIP
jgi:hypothetical protein